MAPVATPTLEPVSTARSLADGWLERALRILGGEVKPTDYLPLTAEVTELLNRDLTSLGVEPSAGTVQRQQTQYLLSYHFGGQNVAYVEDDRGVIVLAVGVDRIADLVREVPFDLCRDVAYTAPDVWM